MFVGRERELAQFEGALATATQGGAAVVLVVGEAGIGKSTLVAHAVAAAGVELACMLRAHIGLDGSVEDSQRALDASYTATTWQVGGQDATNRA